MGKEAYPGEICAEDTKNLYGKSIVKEATIRVWELAQRKRHVLSRGFIASAIVFSGTTMVSRSAAELVWDSADNIMSLPNRLSISPPDFDKIPHYLRRTAEIIEQTPRYAETAKQKIAYEAEEFVAYNKREWTNVGPTDWICYNKFGVEVVVRVNNMPYFHNECSGLHSEKLSREKPGNESKKHIKTPDDIRGEFAKMLLGGLIVLGGIGLGRSKASGFKLDKSKVKDRIDKGIATGLAAKILDFIG